MSDDQGHPRSGGDAGTGRDLSADVDALRADVAALVGRVESVSQELSSLRGRLGDGRGTVVEELQDNLADVASGEVVGALWEEVRQLRTDLPDLVVIPQPVAPTADDESLGHLSAIRAGIDEVRARLDEGLVLTDDSQLPGAAPSGGDDVEALADQVAALRDFVASELDTLRETVAARIDAGAEATASTLATAVAQRDAEPVTSAASAGAVDSDVVEVLRDEIRASGAIADEVIDALRDELKALRRRIAVKASERVLDDQQLAQIADAVAARLAQDRTEG